MNYYILPYNCTEQYNFLFKVGANLPMLSLIKVMWYPYQMNSK